MIYKVQSPKPEHVRVIFELPSCIWADHICLTGDFNGWSKNCQPMRQTRSGVWRTELDLPAGERFEFRYIIDGEWRTDYHADGFTVNRFGTDNSVVIAELPASQAVGQGKDNLVLDQNRLRVDDKRAAEPAPWIASPNPMHALESAA